MTVYKGAICFLKTESGSVPAVTTAHYDVNGDLVDAAFANAVTVDILTLGYQGTRLTGVAIDDATTAFGAEDASDVGKVWAPS